MQLITLTVMNLIINLNEELFLRCYHLEQFSKERISRNDFFFHYIQLMLLNTTLNCRHSANAG